MEVTSGHLLFLLIGFWSGLISAGALAATKNANLAMIVIWFLLVGSKIVLAMVLGNFWITIACGVFIVFSLYILIAAREPQSALLTSVVGLIPISLLTVTIMFG